jgi:hypothetical protein
MDIKNKNRRKEPPRLIALISLKLLVRCITYIYISVHFVRLYMCVYHQMYISTDFCCRVLLVLCHFVLYR